jgi:hypothetical protein
MAAIIKPGVLFKACITGMLACGILARFTSAKKPPVITISFYHL